MALLPPPHLHSAIVLQILALPSTLLLCITSMLRERSINHLDEKRLVRLYKQHAFAFELVQFSVALMACGFIAGNTVAAFEVGEDVTGTIVRSAISRNFLLAGSAVGILVCMSVLDSWRLPGETRDVTDPLFRVTREVVRSYICRHDLETDKEGDLVRPLPYDVEQPYPPLDSTATYEDAQEIKHPNPSDHNPTCTSAPNVQSLITQLQTYSPHHRKQLHPLPSAIRTTSTPKLRSRKRSVTFDLQGRHGDSVKRSRREEWRVVRWRACEMQRREDSETREKGEVLCLVGGSDRDEAGLGKRDVDGDTGLMQSGSGKSDDDDDDSMESTSELGSTKTEEADMLKSGSEFGSVKTDEVGDLMRSESELSGYELGSMKDDGEEDLMRSASELGSVRSGEATSDSSTRAIDT